MSILVESLKDEHAALVNLINEVKRLGISTPESKNKLHSIKEGLIAHLKKEDERLYPRLREVAARDAVVEKTLVTFAKDMEGITKSAMDFFEKYSHESNNLDFFKDVGRLFAALADRIRKEEGSLYPLFDKHFPDE